MGRFFYVFILLLSVFYFLISIGTKRVDLGNETFYIIKSF